MYECTTTLFCTPLRMHVSKSSVFCQKCTPFAFLTRTWVFVSYTDSLRKDQDTCDDAWLGVSWSMRVESCALWTILTIRTNSNKLLIRHRHVALHISGAQKSSMCVPATLNPLLTSKSSGKRKVTKMPGAFNKVSLHVSCYWRGWWLL